MVVILEHINLVLPLKIIGQITIMLEYIQTCIVWLHGAILKHGKVISLLNIVKPDFQYNISFIRNKQVKCLAVAKIVRSQIACNLKSYIVLQDLYSKKYQFQHKGQEMQKLKNRKSKINRSKMKKSKNQKVKIIKFKINQEVLNQ